MASNFSCIGFPFHDEQELLATVERIRPLAKKLGTADGVDVVRWEDSSGARVVLGFRGDTMEDLLPSFAGRPGVPMKNCRPLNATVIAGTVLDTDREPTTSMAFELEQRRAVTSRTQWSGTASVTAFAPSAQFFATEQEFDDSPMSLVNPDADPNDHPPAHALKHGILWPPRMASESFMSVAVFGEPAEAAAEARLNGVVRAVEVRHNTLTGEPFTVSRVSCLGFEVDVLTDGNETPVPTLGSIFAGWVFLAASIDGLDFAPRRPVAGRLRNWFGR